jgi:redox-sensitive bicupin YhaK (pirin superfamily)
MMIYTLHKSETRGEADHGWLKTHHTFSFANYYDPERVHFGMLRVLNDDEVAGELGFECIHTKIWKLYNSSARLFSPQR